MVASASADTVMHCLVCAARMDGLREAGRHQAEHAEAEAEAEAKAEGAESEESRTCVLCGRLFSTQLVREMHVMRWRRKGEEEEEEEGEGAALECQRCLEEFEDAGEKDAHWCTVGMTYSKWQI